ncbi:MAG: Hydrolase, nudix family protein [Labilithrix sp.]|nr:Hydrolase, nudix family protein [Labilithrix sp.]
MRVTLDMAGIHGVTLSPRAGNVELELDHTAGDRRSIVHGALLRALHVRVGDARHRFDPHSQRLMLPSPQAIELLLDDAAGGAPISVATLDVIEARITERPGALRYRLSPFELRYAADTGRIHPVPMAARARLPWRPVTDLHTHFAGCVSGDDLVRLGVEHGVAYPGALLEEAKIRVDGRPEVKLAELGSPVRARLGQRLEVPLDRRVTFLEMERIYRLRSPLTKAPAMFVPLCRQIASDYARMGVRYVELSLGSVVEARVLRAIHAEVPQIENETGVTLRFLAAISRHDDPEWDLDLVERIKSLAGSGYLAGIDVMGHETNSTRVFAPVLRAIAAWADEARRGFVIRVHAGESPSHPENVRVALEAVRGSSAELRIGHGLYGIDDETLAALVHARAVVEFNLDSNVALNHLQSARAVPLRRYLDAGAAVVLGSDGYGIYRTSPEAAAQAAVLAGLDVSRLAGALAETERLKLARLRDVPTFVVPDDRAPVFFTPSVIQRRQAAIAERDAALDARLREIGAPAVAAAKLAELAAGRTVVSIAGAWTQSWEAMTEEARVVVQREMLRFVAGLDTSEAVLVTGGTRHGVEGIVGHAAVERGLTVVAALVRATPPGALEPGAMTHACFVGETLYDKAAGLYEVVADHDGVCLFVGGGQIVSDEIQTAQNLRLRYLLMDGIGGASARHAAEQPGRAFRDGAEALARLRSWSTLRAKVAPHWYEGPNPTVDAVVVRWLGDAPEVLLVLRDLDAPAEPGRWALPGGFVASSAPRGERWSGAESDVEACLRELSEETGLVVDAAKLVPLGRFEGGGRDPRDTPHSWSRSTAFLVVLSREGSGDAIAGGDDAGDARWFSLDRLPALAFDHGRILDVARERLAASGQRSTPRSE